MKRMLQTTPLLLALTAGLSASVASAQEGSGDRPPQKPQDEPKVLEVGDTVPKGVKLTDVHGKPFSFEEARGKVVAIHFWSITCPWEKAAEPKLMQMAAELTGEGKDVVFLAINANASELGDEPAPEAFENEDPADRPYGKLRKKAEQSEFNHRILVDHSGDVARLLDAKSTPHCFVVDKKGVLVYSGALDDNGRGEPKQRYLRDAIEAAQKGEEVATPTTRPYG